MFRSTRNFFKRNRTNFAIGFGLAGVGYLATNYVISKFSEARDRRSSDRIAREKLTRRFEQYQDDCTPTVLGLLPTATELILEELPVEKITQELQLKKAAKIAKGQSITDGGSEVSTAATFPQKDDDAQSLQSFASESFVMASKEGDDRPRKSNKQLWDEIKISSLTRSLTLVYTLALLTLLTRVQLNLLGRQKYLSSVVSNSERDEPTIRLEEETADGYGTEYLAFSWWLLHKGWRSIAERVDVAVKQVFRPWNARKPISLGQLRQLIADTRAIVETEQQESSTKWLHFLLPPKSEEAALLVESGISTDAAAKAGNAADLISPALRRLLDETSDLIDSPTANTVMAQMLNAAFSHLVDVKLKENAFKPKAAALPPTQEEEISQQSRTREEVDDAATTKFGSILAVLTRQAHSIGGGISNEYLEVMEQQKELEAFGAVVYSSNFDYVAQSGEDGGAA